MDLLMYLLAKSLLQYFPFISYKNEQERFYYVFWNLDNLSGISFSAEK